jgi:hypothetical protein
MNLAPRLLAAFLIAELVLPLDGVAATKSHPAAAEHVSLQQASGAGVMHALNRLTCRMAVRVSGFSTVLVAGR